MPKDATYHESAIIYNREIAQFAEDLAPTLSDEEVQRWSRAVAKQHRFHEGRHKKALNKIREQEQDDYEKGPELNPGPVMDELEPVATDVDTQSIQDAQAEFAQKTEAEQNAQIDALHGPGAAEALEAAYADGSIFGESEMDSEEDSDVETGSEAVLETGIIDPDSVLATGGGAVMDDMVSHDQRAEEYKQESPELCEGGFPRSMPVNDPTGCCTSSNCGGGHPLIVEKESNA